MSADVAPLRYGSVLARRAMNSLSGWENWKLHIAFGSAFILLTFVGALSYRSISESNESALWVTHTRDVLKSIELLRYSMEAITSNIRGFLITGDDFYLATYRANLADVRQQNMELRNLTADNPEQQRKIPALEVLIAHKSSAQKCLYRCNERPASRRLRNQFDRDRAKQSRMTLKLLPISSRRKSCDY